MYLHKKNYFYHVEYSFEYFYYIVVNFGITN